MLNLKDKVSITVLIFLHQENTFHFKTLKEYAKFKLTHFIPVLHFI